MTSTVLTPQSMPQAEPTTEAARYALLRRLTPSFRHHLVVNLQPIGMVYEIMDRRLRAPQADLADIHDNAQKINGFARAALDSCLDVVTWLAPDESAKSTAVQGVGECLSLLATSLTFRGYAVRNEVMAIAGEIRRPAIRSVLTAAILHATDQTPAPADLVISAQQTPQALALTLTLRPTEGDRGFSAEMPYRALAWSDVQSLADAESVGLSHEGRQKLRLVIPWVTPAA